VTFFTFICDYEAVAASWSLNLIKNYFLSVLKIYGKKALVTTIHKLNKY
jgi:hypothetical protein